MSAVENRPAEGRLKVAIAQMAPVWLDREKTLAKMMGLVEQAGSQDCRLLVFGEALLPGYPFWIERTDGARFNHPVQKALHARYLDQAVQIEAGHLDPFCQAAARYGLAIYVGCMERAPDRGGHSLYCCLVFIDTKGKITSVHRKLVPTYEERLTWAQGDGHGLRVHRLGAFTVGGLNCWENWMPLVRASLYGQGENLHVAVWPGGIHNTEDITRFMAKEGRSYVISAAGLMRPDDFPAHTPHRDLILAQERSTFLANGGSCIAGPDGEWVVAPQIETETLLVAELDYCRVLEERQNFDPSGHYARPDVTRLTVDRRRQRTLILED
jgi:nitrilase